MTLQEIYDKTVNHLRSQGCKSKEPNSNRCLYRGPNGTKCAVGCHIPDEDYRKAMEDQSARHLLETTKGIGNIENTLSNRDLLSALQITHDNYDVKSWEDRFQIIAREQNLIYTPKEEIPE